MRIEVTFHDTHQKQVFEVDSNRCLVGRGTSADVIITREELSRKHFLIESKNGEFYLTDLESKNGIQVNGSKIVPNKPTLYRSFYPLDVCGIIGFEIKHSKDNTLGLMELPKEITQTKPERKNIFAERTPKAPRRELEREKGGLRRSLSMAVAVMVLGYVAYYMDMFHGKEPEAEKVATATTTRSSMEIPDMSTFDFKDYFKQNQCKQYADLCKGLGLIREQEGVALIGGNLFIFINTSTRPGEGASPAYLSLPEQEKMEILLASFGTHPSVKSFVEVHKPNHIMVVGFQIIADFVRPQYVLNVDQKFIPPLNEETHQFVFSEIFFTGNKRLYEKHLKTVVAIVPL